MKNISKLVAGTLLNIIAAPVVVTGKAAQTTGSALSTFGVNAELRGLRMGDDGAAKVATAKLDMSRSREERKAERAAEKQRVQAERYADRKIRIRQLELMAAARRMNAEEQLEAIQKMTSAFAPQHAEFMQPG